jgi:hypothetical protein
MTKHLLALIVAGLLAACATPSGGGRIPTPVPEDSAGGGASGGGARVPGGGGTADGATTRTSGEDSDAGTSGDSGKGSQIGHDGDVGGNSGAGGEAGANAAGGGTDGRGTGSADTGAQKGNTGAAGTADPGVAATPAERRALADARLQASLDQFDAQLRKEQEEIARQRDARAAGGAGTSGSPGAEDPLDRYGTGRDTALARNRAGDLRSEGTGRGTEGSGPGQSGGGPGAAGSAPGNASGVVAREIPSGEDDDIIARRLRKAAEAETDPELKEKLWKEYIDYKENTQKGG